ncbi:MAG TPA: Ig-like domain-containing protein, partial [Gemmatimonadaceae bacterium]|nr:Ig-like domain-containing protein [Gemmatimonadaceae bacterium]
MSLAVTTPSILVGGTTSVVATLLDREGKVIEDRTPVWSSLTPAVVSVTQDGVVTGLQSGTGQVRASSGHVSADATVTVTNPTAAAIQLARDTASLFLPGGTVQAIAAVTDAAGHPLSRPQIAWSSSAPQIATVNVAGLVTAVASGNATISAAVDGLSASMVVTVRPVTVAGAPTITAVAPATLRPGTVTTVTGTNFAPSVAGNQVVVDGIPATVVGATATQLTLVMPTAGFTCDPTRDAFMQVTANGLIGGGAVPLQVASRRELAPGQSVVVTNPAEVRCNELVPADGRWVVSVYNASRAAVTPTATANALFAVRGVAGAALGGSEPQQQVAPPAGAPRTLVTPVGTPRGQRFTPRQGVLAADERARLATHADIMARNIAAAAVRAAAP